MRTIDFGPPASRRGFTLLEMVFALFVGALLVAVAANLARFGAQRAGKGEEQNALNQRVRLLRNQIKADLELAGLGSTGAIAVPGGVTFWDDFTVTTVAGFSAIPALRGGDNLAGGTVPMVPGSDAVQMVVADPSTRQRTSDVSPQGGSTLNMAGPLDCPPFGLVYVTDHSAPNGAGRTHIMTIPVPSAAGAVAIEGGAGTLAFTIAAGSDVMCARVSTYWLECQGDPAICPRRWLRRNDLDPSVASEQLGASDIRLTNAVASPDDLISPGVVDLQIAYSFSSELAPRIGTDNTRWAFDGDGAGGLDADPALASGGRGWFETRQVRVNLLLRTLREIDQKGGAGFSISPTLLENQTSTAAVAIPVGYGRQVMTSSVLLTNLRFFDFNSAMGLAAEPF